MISLLLLPGLLLAWADSPPKGDEPVKPSPFEIAVALETAVSDAIAKAEPSVVAIHRQKNEVSSETLAVRGRKNTGDPQDGDAFDIHDLRAGDPRTAGPRGPEEFISLDHGSGVVVGNEGQILTAFHVVRGARFLAVRAANRQSFWAEVIAADPRSDLAVIAPKPMPGRPAPKLEPLVIGDSSALRKGSFLIVLGNPFNAARDGKPSASWGILSNVARRLNLNFSREPNKGQVRDDVMLSFPTLLQLDAKLNLGMSGGAVVNFKGELVGVTTMAESPVGFDSQAGYAIPMDRMGRRAVELLKQGKEVEYGLLGIKPAGRSTNKIEAVIRNKPAELAGLLVDDEIVAVDDVPVADFDSLILAINARNPGEAVPLKVLRNGRIFEKTVELSKYTVEGEVIATNVPDAWRGLRVDYEPASQFIRVDLEFTKPPLPSVLVTSVEEGTPAAAAGVKKGHFIRGVGGRPVPTPRKFAEAVSGLDGPVTLDTDTGPITVPGKPK